MFEWNQIEQHPEYQKASTEQKGQIRKAYNRKYAMSPEGAALEPERPIVPVSYDRSTPMDMLNALSTGVVGAIGQFGSALRSFDLDPLDNNGVFDQWGTGLKNWADDKKRTVEFLRPDIAQARGEEGWLKRGFRGALESVPQTFVPLAAAVAGSVVNPAVGIGLGTTALISQFGFGTYGEQYESGYRHLKQARPELTEEEVQDEAHTYALKHAAFEVGTEFATNLAGLFSFGGAKALKQPLQATIKDFLFDEGKDAAIKRFGKTMMRVAPVEVAGEMVAAAGQSAADRSIDLSDVGGWEAAGEAILPSVLMSLMFGGATYGLSEAYGKKIRDGLNDTENVGNRYRAARTITKDIRKQFKDDKMAMAFWQQALENIEQGREIKIDDQVVQFAKTKLDDEIGAVNRANNALNVRGQGLTAEQLLNLRNDDAALNERGVGKADIDALILEKFEGTPVESTAAAALKANVNPNFILGLLQTQNLTEPSVNEQNTRLGPTRDMPEQPDLMEVPDRGIPVEEQLEAEDKAGREQFEQGLVGKYGEDVISQIEEYRIGKIFGDENIESPIDLEELRRYEEYNQEIEGFSDEDLEQEIFKTEEWITKKYGAEVWRDFTENQIFQSKGGWDVGGPLTEAEQDRIDRLYVEKWKRDANLRSGEFGATLEEIENVGTKLEEIQSKLRARKNGQVAEAAKEVAVAANKQSVNPKPESEVEANTEEAIKGNWHVDSEQAMSQFYDYFGGDSTAFTFEQQEDGRLIVRATDPLTGNSIPVIEESITEINKLFNNLGRIQGNSPLDFSELDQTAVKPVKQRLVARSDIFDVNDPRFMASAQAQYNEFSTTVRAVLGPGKRDEFRAVEQLLKARAQSAGLTPQQYVALRNIQVHAGEFRSHKKDSTPIKGSFEITKEGISLIKATELADISTFAHEFAHLFRVDLAISDKSELLADAELWAGVENGRWTTEAEEKFARGFERYLAEGKAPNSNLARVFEQFKKWLINIYQTLTGSEIDVKLSPEITKVFDALLTRDQVLDTRGTPRQTQRMNQSGVVPVYPTQELYQVADPKRIFFSPLKDKLIVGGPKKATSPELWRNILGQWRKKGTLPGNIAEELEFSGFEEWLEYKDTVGEQVGRKDIEEFFEKGGVQVLVEDFGIGLVEPLQLPDEKLVEKEISIMPESGFYDRIRPIQERVQILHDGREYKFYDWRGRAVEGLDGRPLMVNAKSMYNALETLSWMDVDSQIAIFGDLPVNPNYEQDNETANLHIREGQYSAYTVDRAHPRDYYEAVFAFPSVRQVYEDRGGDVADTMALIEWETQNLTPFRPKPAYNNPHFNSKNNAFAHYRAHLTPHYITGEDTLFIEEIQNDTKNLRNRLGTIDSAEIKDLERRIKNVKKDLQQYVELKSVQDFMNRFAEVFPLSLIGQAVERRNTENVEIYNKLFLDSNLEQLIAIQSDLPEDVYNELRSGLAEISHNVDKLFYQPYEKLDKRLQNEYRKVAKMPFDKNYSLLALKHAIATAVNKGINYVTLSGSDIQTARWEEDTFADTVKVVREPDGTLSWGFYHGGGLIGGESGTVSELTKYLGDDRVATIEDDLANSENNQILYVAENNNELFRIKGFGKRNLYDSVFKNQWNKFLKKYGAQLEVMPIDTEIPNSRYRDVLVIDTHRPEYGVESDKRYVVQDIHLKTVLGETDDFDEARAIQQKYQQKTPVGQGFKITPEMIEAVQGRGLPLFQETGRFNSHSNSTTNTQEFREWFRKSVVKIGDDPVVLWNTSLDPELLSTNETDKYKSIGIWLTGDSVGMIDAVQGRGVSMPYYVRLQNPHNITQAQLKLELNKFDDDGYKYQQHLREQGYDGVFINDGAAAIIFDGDQLYSAATEVSPFTATNMKRLYQTVAEDNNWDIPRKDTLGQSFMYNIVDKLDPLKRVQKAIKNALKPDQEFDNALDVYQAESLRVAKAKFTVDQYMANDWQPIMDEVQNSGIGLADIEEFMYARHAGEANERLRYINSYRALKELVDFKRGIARQQLEEDIQNVKDLAEAAGEEFPELQRHYYELLLRNFEANKDRTGYTADEIRDSDTQVQREAMLKERWDKFFAKPSGMTDKEAEDTLKKLGKNRKLVGIAESFQALTDKKIELMLDAEMISQDEADRWRMYDFYVPLRREGYEDMHIPTGRGIESGGKPAKVRMGSTARATNILANIQADFYQAAIRAGKLEIGKKLYKLIQEYPNPDFWTVTRAKQQPYFDSDGNIVLYNNKLEKGLNAIPIRLKGQQHIIKFEHSNETAVRLYKALANDMYDHGPIVDKLSSFTRFLAMLNTSLSPEFMLGNFPRDVQTAMANMASTELAGMQKRVVKDVFKSGFGIWKAIRGDKNNPWSDTWDDFRQHGGQVSWLSGYESPQQTAESIQKDIETAIGKGQIAFTKRNLKKIVGGIENANMAIENAVRVSFYKHAVDMFLTNNPNATEAEITQLKERAAYLAKELTTNFEKKGAYGQLINSLYMFFNAGVQGNYRIVKALMKSKKLRAGVAASVPIAMAMDMVNRAFSDEDENGEKYYDQVPQFEKERNILLTVPGFKMPFKIPLPWGYNVFWVMGTQLGELAGNPNKSVFEAAAETVIAAANAFNPMQASTLLQTAVPTFLDPLAMMSENKTAFGTPLKPEQFPSRAPTPEYQQHWQSVRWPSKMIAQGANWISGGDTSQPGKINFSPEYLDVLWDTFSGSAGRFVADTVGLPFKYFDQETDLEVKDVPFVRRLKSGYSEHVSSQLYHDRVKEILTLQNQLKDPMISDDKKARLRQRPQYQLISPTVFYEAQLRKLRKYKRAYEDNPEQVERYEEMINGIYYQFNQRYREAMGYDR